jgi:hypothetical protein
VDAQVRTLGERFVSEFEPAIRGAAIPAMRLAVQVAEDAIGTLSRFTQGVGRFVQSLDALPGFLGAVGTAARAVASAPEDAAPSDLFADELQGALTSMRDSIELTRRKFEVGLIPRSEMLSQIADVREGTVEELLKLQSKFEGLLPDSLIDAQLGKLEAVERKLANINRISVEVPELAPATPADPEGPSPLQGSFQPGQTAVGSLQQQSQMLQRVWQQVKQGLNVIGQAGVRFTQTMSAGVGTVIGQILTFQKRVTGLGEVFKSVGKTIVQSLQQVVSQLIRAVTQAAILSTIISVIPGLNAIGDASGFGGLLGNAIPFLDSGGLIAETGLAVVHSGEMVLPAAKVQQMQRPSPGGTLTASIGFDEILFELDRRLKGQGQPGLYVS